MAIKKSTETAITNYNEALAKLAAKQKDVEKNTGGGSNYSILGGKLKLAGNEIPGNQMGVICLDAVLMNVLYTEAYDPDEKTAPACYAYGTDEESMTPHDEVEKPQSEDCKSCEHNQWGSAEKGRGKACSNRRRIACIPAGIFNQNGKFEPYTEAADFESSTISMLNIPPTSLKGWGAFVKALTNTNVPTLGVIARVSVEMNPYATVSFSALSRVPMGLIPTIMKRYEEAQKLMETPFPKASEAPVKMGKTTKKKY